MKKNRFLSQINVAIKELYTKLKVFNLKILQILKRRWINLKIIFGRIYKKLKLEYLIYFILFLFHRYSANQFSPKYVSNNLRTLVRVKNIGWMDTSREGELQTLESNWEKFFFKIKNFLLFGAFQSRVEKVVYFTFVTISLELNNPFTEKMLLNFLPKKMAFMQRLLTYIKKINGKFWDQGDILLHIKVYQKNSLLQARVIRKMHMAVRHQSEPEIVKEVKRGMKKGYYPLLITVGVSGAYWMRGTNREILGLFKPFDEEIHAPNNPLGPICQGTLGLRKTRWGCCVGEASHHEVAAFIVDEYFGFGIVPRTYYASFSHHTFFSSREDPYLSNKVTKTKMGSFQEFVGGFEPIDKVSQNEWSTIPLDEFQLLVVLDVIIGNTDRNIGNLLLGDEKLAAIDHGLCFPDRLDELSYWYWGYFALGKKPLLPSLIHLLDHFPFEELSYKLKKGCYLSVESLSRMRERVVLFREGIHAGMMIDELQGLMHAEYLFPLIELDSTLTYVAKEQVKRFQEKRDSNLRSAKD